MSANIKEVEDTIAAYLRQATADFTINGVNLLRLACNHARKRAERMHDWHHTAGSTVVTTSATGEFTIPAAIKQFNGFYLRQSDVDVPLHYASRQTGAVWAKDRMAKRSVDGSVRYLSDNDISITAEGYTNLGIYAPYEVFIQGRIGQLFPKPSVAKSVVVDGFLWMDDYDADADTDFFVTHGSDFLLWSSIVEVNHHNHVFTDNQEGNVSPPLRYRDEAFATLIEHDNFQIDGYRIPRR